MGKALDELRKKIYGSANPDQTTTKAIQAKALEIRSPSPAKTTTTKTSGKSSFPSFSTKKTSGTRKTWSQVSSRMSELENSLKADKDELDRLDNNLVASPSSTNLAAYNRVAERYQSSIAEYNSLVNDYDYYQSLEGLRDRQKQAAQERDSAHQAFLNLYALESNPGATGTKIASAGKYKSSSEAQKAWKKAEADYNSALQDYYKAENEAKLKSLKRNVSTKSLYNKAKDLESDLKTVQTMAETTNITGTSNSKDLASFRKKYGLTGSAYDIQKALQKKLDSVTKSLEDSGFSYERISGFEQREESEKAYKKKQAEWTEFAEKHPVLSSAASVLASPFQGVDFVKMVSSSGKNSDETNLDTYVPPNSYDADIVNFVNTVRGTVSDELEKNTDWEIFGQNVASFLYQTGLSIAESAGQVAALGPGATFVMGSSAAANQAADVIQRGGTTKQAFLGGLTAGIAEGLFEKVSIERLLDPTKFSTKTVKDTLLSLAKQGGVEASEESLTEISNILTDAAIMSKDSSYELSVQAYMQAGMTEDEARKKAFEDSVSQVVLAGAGGFLSGVTLAGARVSIGKAVDTANASLVGAQLNRQLSNGVDTSVRSEIQKGLNAPDGSEARLLAESAQKQIDAKKRVTNATLGRLVWANQGEEAKVFQEVYANQSENATPEAQEVLKKASQEMQMTGTLTFATASELRSQAAKQETGGDTTAQTEESTKAANPTATVESTTVTAFTDMGMPLKTARRKAEVVQKLMDGDAVSNSEIDSIDPKNPVTKQAFSRITGVEFPEGRIGDSQLYNLYRSAKDVKTTQQVQTDVDSAAEQAAAASGYEPAPASIDSASQEMYTADEDTQAESQPRTIGDMLSGMTVNPETQDRIDEALDDLKSQVDSLDIDLDGNPLPSFSEFSERYTAAFPDATEDQVRKQYQAFRGDSQTLLFGGHNLTRKQFRELIRTQSTVGAQMSDDQIDSLFNQALLDSLGDDAAVRILGSDEDKKADAESRKAKRSAARVRKSRSELKLDNGKSINRSQFKAFFRDYYAAKGTETTDSELDSLFDVLLSRQDNGETVPYDAAMEKYLRGDTGNGDEGQGAVSVDSGLSGVSDESSGQQGAGVSEGAGRAQAESRERGNSRSQGQRSDEGVQPEARGVALQSGDDGDSQEVKVYTPKKGPNQDAADKLRKRIELNPKAVKKVKVRGLKADPDALNRQFYTKAMKEAERGAASIGFRVRVVVGKLVDQSGATANGMTDLRNKTMFVQADDPNYSFEQIFNHEKFHADVSTDPRLREVAWQAVLSELPTSVSEADLGAQIETQYGVSHGKVYQDTGDQQVYREEFLADLNAGMNRMRLPQKMFDILSKTVREAEGRWSDRRVKNARQEEISLGKAQDKAEKESSDSIKGRAFSVTTEMPWDEQIDNLENFDTRQALYIEETPNILAEVGLRDLPMCMTKTHAEDIMHPKDPSNVHWHGLSPETVKRLPELLSKPAMILDSWTNRGDIIVVLTDSDSDGLPLVATIHPDGQATVDGVRGPANFITSVYGRNNFGQRLGTASRNNFLYLALRNNSILYWNKNRTEALAQRFRLHLPTAMYKVPSDTILRDHSGAVKADAPDRMFSTNDYGEEIPQFNNWNEAFLYYENEYDGKLAFAEPPVPGGEAEFGMVNADGDFVTFGTYPVTDKGLAKFNFDIEDHMEQEAEQLGLEELEGDDLSLDDGYYDDIYAEEQSERIDPNNPWRQQDPNLSDYDIRVQQDHEGFTPTDTPAFKAWFHDDSGELTNPDGKPKIFMRGSVNSGSTVARPWSEARSGGIFFTTRQDIATGYAEGSTVSDEDSRVPSPMEVAKGPAGIGRDSRTEWRAEYVKSWKSAQNYLEEYFTNYDGDGVVLEGYNPETKRAVKFSNAKAFRLRTNLNSKEKFAKTGDVFTKWRTLGEYPKTAEGLDQFNRELGEIIRRENLGIHGFGKYYLSAKHTLVVDALYNTYMSIPKDQLPEAVREPTPSKRQHINNVARMAFQNGYDCVVVKNVYDDGAIQNQYIVGDSRQIKSVYNKGTWDSGDPDFKFSTSQNLDDFMLSLEREYGEGVAHEMFRTLEQLERAKARAEQRAADAEAAQQAAEWMANAEVEAARQEERDRADQRLNQQRDAANERARRIRAKDRAAKVEAVRSARLAEQMNAGRTWAERLRRQQDRATETQNRMRQEAQQRQAEMRSAHETELDNTRLAERMNAGRTWARRLTREKNRAAEDRERRIQDHKLASEDAKKAAQILRKYQKGDTEKLSNDPVSTLRDAYHKPAVSESVRKAAEALRTVRRNMYRDFVNGTMAIDDFSKLQTTDANASVLLRNAISANSIAQTIRQENLVAKDGSVLDGQSLEDVAVCWTGSGKSRKYDDASQIIFQDYLLHRHNIDRMGIRENARKALEDFESEHSWLTSLDPREFSLLVADENQTAMKYQQLIESYQSAKNKPIFAGSDGSPLGAEYSRSMVEQYETDYPWLKDKAETLYKWWDKFMREWVVGESLSQTEYETMHTLYPSYVPTYRKDKNGFAFGVNTFGGTASTRKGARKATGGTSPVANVEDSFMRLMRQNVINQRANAVLRSITDSAMLDEDGTFNGFAIFNWNDLTKAQKQAMAEDGVEGAVEAKTDQVAAKAIQNEGGGVYRVRSWNNGQQVSAFVNEELYKALDFAFNQKTGWFTRVGQLLTTPMKTAITGANPGFAIRNMIRDNLTAQVNSIAVVNSISGIKFEKYYARAWSEMFKDSDHWKQFQALGGTNATWYNNEGGSYVDAIRKRSRAELNPINKTVAALSFIGERAESATRFAEYLATIDRLPGGDTYTNRMIGIKNAAEVTVDFSRKGTKGKAINAWVPYWNPAVQGIDKVFRTFFNQPTVAGKLKTLSRATLTTVPLDILLYAIYAYTGRKDDWEELNDRTKDTYYCIPIGDSHTFLKIPKSRDWGQLIGTPITRMLQGLDGREDPFKNYLEVSFIPNFVPPMLQDTLGFSWLYELGMNEDFAGRAIVPAPYSDMAKGDQWNGETSRYAKLIADIGNTFSQEDWLSPMQIDYIIDDYFGDFGSMFHRLLSIEGPDKELPTEEQAQLVAEDLFGNWIADNRYSSSTVSDYYDMLDRVSQAVTAERNQNPDGYQDTPLYKLNSAFNATGSPVQTISDLNAQVRDLPDGPEKDALKQEIIGYAQDALDMYDKVMSGESTEPKMEMEYGKYGSDVSRELISLSEYADDYAFQPTTYKPSSYEDPQDDTREYVLKGDDEAQDKYREIYDDQYGSVMEEAIRSGEYRSSTPEERAELLEAARDDVSKQAKDEFLDWLEKNRKSTLKD